MVNEFWIERWEAGQIGFHRPTVHPLLEKHWSEVSLDARDAVLAPLCGKSVDLMWLRECGHAVVGVELSETAVRAFYEERGLRAKVVRHSSFQAWSAGDIRILCGDFFDIGPDDLGPIRGVYDRAALVALPPAMRVRYAAHLQRLVDGDVRIFLITLAYPQHQMTGPPFSVEDEEVRRLFEDTYDVRLLAEKDVLKDHLHFAQRGLTELVERAYVLAYR